MVLTIQEYYKKGTLTAVCQLDEAQSRLAPKSVYVTFDNNQVVDSIQELNSKARFSCTRYEFYVQLMAH